jgi:L-malate glycosyltransferase
VVATDVGANAQLLDNGRCGLLVPANDGGALCAAFGELLAHPLRAAGFGSAARRRAEREYSRTAMTARFADFYRELVN